MNEKREFITTTQQKHFMATALTFVYVRICVVREYV